MHQCDEMMMFLTSKEVDGVENNESLLENVFIS